jgi:predicted Zn-dependent protease
LIIETALSKPVARVAAGLSALTLCALLGYAGLKSFITGVLTDERVPVSREQLAAGAKYASDSAALQARLAEAEMESGERDLAGIEARVLRVINMSPWNYNYPLLLASVRETKGDRAGAEQAMRAALELAPNSTTVHWRLANLLLRQGKLAAALGEFRKATMADLAHLRRAA